MPALAVPPDQEMDAPTTREGYKARNDRQRWHEANLYKFHAQGRKMGANATVGIYPHTTLPPRGQTQEGALTCSSNTIAIVTVYNQRPVLSRGEAFIFTEFKVEVNETLRGSIRVGDRTTITQLGGDIDLPADKLHYDDATAQLMSVGRQYLAFLRYLPATNDYAFLMAYELQPGGLTRRLTHGYPSERSDLVATTRTAAISASASCQ